MVALEAGSCLELSPLLVAEECLLAAEESAEQVLNCVQPTLDSEERRRDVVDYIQHLLKSRLHCEVVSYGSVPLKTYLPEGDIDLTVLKGPNAEETLINDVLAVIQEEERNQNSEYEVRETQFIDAEKVKLVKCLCRNITIDISCNQLGGISTLCFLEKVDQFIGRGHLFKRSIILVKSWCYYESRILGAHHGLMSTYALEILVLYIFHFFHSSLDGPLSVLHRFLNYYSQFDWENYCVSLKGPVRRSSLPEIVVSMPVKPPGSPLLSEEFLESCIEMFSTYCKEQGKSKPLQIKHLNIIDPLLENNNLGRSVNRGNYFRIRSALKYGSHKLEQILSRSKEEVVDEILGYFANTVGRNGHWNRSIIQSVALDIDDEEESFVPSPAALSHKDGMLLNSYGFGPNNDTVYWEPVSSLSVTDDLSRSCTTGEGLTELTSGSCSGAEGAGTISTLETSFSSLWCGAVDDVSSSDCSLYPSEDQFCVENGSLGIPEGDPFLGKSIDSPDDCSEGAYTNSSIYATRLSDSSNGRELDTISIDEESEVLDALADLTGDYDNHVRSLLRGQLCHRFPSASSFPGIPLSASSSFSSRSQMDMNPQTTSSNYCAVKANTMTARDGSVHVPPDRAAGDSPFSGNVLRCQWNQKAQGIGTYFPNTSVVNSGRPSLGMIMNKLHASQESLPPKVHHQKTTSHGRSRKSNFRGNKERSPPVKERAIHRFNEREFPPLPCTRNKSVTA